MNEKTGDHGTAPNSDQLQELTNITLELHALYRIFDHAASGKTFASEEASRIYRDVASLIRPLCLRLDRLQEEMAAHPGRRGA